MLVKLVCLFCLLFTVLNKQYNTENKEWYDVNLSENLSLQQKNQTNTVMDAARREYPIEHTELFFPLFLFLSSLQFFFLGYFWCSIEHISIHYNFRVLVQCTVIWTLICYRSNSRSSSNFTGHLYRKNPILLLKRTHLDQIHSNESNSSF